MAEKNTAAAAFASRIDEIVDLQTIDMHKLKTETTYRNMEALRKWSKDMDHHEAHSKQPYERVYLVASDLRAVTASQQHSSKVKWRISASKRQQYLFLPENELESLYEKHWAIEVDGYYYELLRDELGSHFSSAIRVEDCDRQIAARVFIGTTHCAHDALEEIGKAVIATQTKYELTRSNCHRFVRVFTTLGLCSNHIRDTIPSLPFDVEEHIATRGSNTRTGLRGWSVGKNFGLLYTSPYREDYMHYASRTVGQGAEWQLERDDFGVELKLTIRRLKQKTKRQGSGDDAKTVNINEFKVDQEETTYLAEYDQTLLSRAYGCRALNRNPYLTIIRFDRVTKYDIAPSGTSGSHIYKSTRSKGMIKGPWGVTWSNGTLKRLHPAELIRDNQVWRDGDGRRLDRLDSTWDRVLGDLKDALFGVTNRESFRYRVPVSPMISLGIHSLEKSLDAKIKKIF